MAIVGDGVDTDVWIAGELAPTIEGDLTGATSFPLAYARPSLAYDEVAAYDRQLTAAEIQGTFSQG